MSFGPAFDPFAQRLKAFGASLGARAIQPGDELAFVDPALESTPENLARRRASGAARVLAAELLRQLGLRDAPTVARGPGGAPIWPAGFIGSIAHDHTLAVVALAPRGGAVAALGIDIEPAEPLPGDLADLVLTKSERRAFAGDPLAGRAAFAAKEAVYKAINPLEGLPLEYDDIVCDRDLREAALRDGRRLSLVTATSPRILAAAFLASARGRTI